MPTVSVSADDIKRGIKQEVRRVSAGEGYVMVQSADRRLEWHSPPLVRAFIYDYDLSRPVRPFKFELLKRDTLATVKR